MRHLVTIQKEVPVRREGMENAAVPACKKRQRGGAAVARYHCRIVCSTQWKYQACRDLGLIHVHHLNRTIGAATGQLQLTLLQYADQRFSHIEPSRGRGRELDKYPAIN
jgi:hypothetical protein